MYPLDHFDKPLWLLARGPCAPTPRTPPQANEGANDKQSQRSEFSFVEAPVALHQMRLPTLKYLSFFIKVGVLKF